MRRTIAPLVGLFLANPTYASFADYFRDEQGETKWQYIANFSSSVLILLLSASLITLFFSHRKKVKANRALKEIRDELEQRVDERTASLSETTALLQKSEAYVKNILQSMPSILIGLDAQLNITQWNRSAHDITGLSAEKTLGKNLWDAYPKVTIAPEQVQEVIDTGQPSTILHSQRGQYYFDIRIYPLLGELHGGVVILIENVTQRSLAENMLVQRDKMSSMGELAAIMAYDISVPLDGMFADLHEAETLASALAPESDALYSRLVNATNKGQQVSAIVQNLLAFSRSQGGKKSVVSMVDVIEHVVVLAEKTLADPAGLRFHDITLERNFEEKLPKVPCYVAEMQQVFLSLFRHCVHALAIVTRDNFTPTITLEIAERYDALWIKIQHNGQGLTAEQQQDIFEPFFNSWPVKKQSVEPENRLSFTSFILTDHHQGQVALTSSVDIGTTFHIQLQLK